jgi:phosphate transport system substrate-binding protein
MRKAMMLMGVACAMVLSVAFTSMPAAGQGLTINGAGASFPNPIYQQWAFKYESLTGVKIAYQSIGSGGGIKAIQAKTVNFAGSDAPLKAEDLDKDGLIQFPMVVGGVVPIVNVTGIGAGRLKLTPELLAGIFLGDIRKWDDAAIKAANPDLNLPSRDITVVHRSDGSGTTWIFTSYLDKVSPKWREQVGFGTAVKWPTGVGGAQNAGVAAMVQRVNGAIGYVEYAYAIQGKLAYTQMKNQAGKFLSPSIKVFQAAAANADWQATPGYAVALTDQPGDDSWPITGATFILLHKEQKDAARAKALLDYFAWCYRHGAEMAEKLDYVPMPENVYRAVETTWSESVKVDGKPVWSKPTK